MTHPNDILETINDIIDQTPGTDRLTDEERDTLALRLEEALRPHTHAAFDKGPDE